MNLRALTALWLTVICASSALGGDSPCGFSLWMRPWLRAADCPRLCGLPDDYCRKPCPPIIPVSRCGGHDDYCRKAAPCLFPVSPCGSCDDYCRKSMPCLLCPPLSQCGHYDYGMPSGVPQKLR